MSIKSLFWRRIFMQMSGESGRRKSQLSPDNEKKERRETWQRIIFVSLIKTSFPGIIKSECNIRQQQVSRCISIAFVFFSYKLCFLHSLIVPGILRHYAFHTCFLCVISTIIISLVSSAVVSLAPIHSRHRTGLYPLSHPSLRSLSHKKRLKLNNLVKLII